jgi:hypothetical protein
MDCHDGVWGQGVMDDGSAFMVAVTTLSETSCHRWVVYTSPLEVLLLSRLSCRWSCILQ